MTTLTIGSRMVSAAWDAVTGPAWNELWMRKSPSTPVATSAYGSQLVNTRDQPSVISVVNCLVSAADRANSTAPDAPNIAARNQLGPVNPSPTQAADAAPTTTKTMIHEWRPGTTSPPPGAATTRKVARPPAAAMEPPHSLHVRW